MYKAEMKHKNKSYLLFASLAAVLMVNACANTNLNSKKSVKPQIAADLDKQIKADAKSEYPVLYKIPEVPKDLMTDAEWDAFNKSLKTEQVAFEKKPDTFNLTKKDSDISWANKDRAIVTNDAKSAPVPEFDGIAWAARMRAIIDSKTNTTAQ